MITSLSIKNFALIEDVSVPLLPGFTAITGETGAGKSIILGALGLVLGKRADIAAVRDASKKCVVEAVFSLQAYALEKTFGTLGIDHDPQTIIRREILPSGKSRAFVNDTPVNLTNLQQLAPHLVAVHSQHQTLEIASENFQIEVLDALAENGALLAEYTLKRAEHTSILKELTLKQQQKSETEKELDYNTFLHNELKEAVLAGIDQTELEQRHATLSHAEEITGTLAQVYALLSEERSGTLQTLKGTRQLLGKLKPLAPQFETLWDRTNSVVIEMEDIFETVVHISENSEADPVALLALNETLATVHRLQKKHNVATVAALVEIENRLAKEISTTQNIDKEIEALAKKLALSKAGALQVAATLSKKRKAAIPLVKQKLGAYLSTLGMPHAQFEFVIEETDSFNAKGTNTLQVLFSANKGIAPGPLKKVASGGELSRIMLSIKALLAQYKQLPTLIFDEIDTG
ncbi:MAG: DNA repair protein RecN, partial [Marinirhabdus sp.]